MKSEPVCASSMQWKAVSCQNYLISLTWFCGLPYVNLFHLLVRNYEIWAVAFTLLAIFSFYRTNLRYIYILIAVENARHLLNKRYGNILDHRIDVVVPFSVSDTGGSKVKSEFS